MANQQGSSPFNVLDINVIIDEIVEKRAKTKGLANIFAPTQKKLFHECWRAINSWILLRMKKKQGVIIPSFGKFAWEFISGKEFQNEEENTGEKNVEEGTLFHEQNIKARPVFLPSKQFCKAAKIKYTPWGPENMYSSCEEANLSKISIKHSKFLTKDTLFIGLRDIFGKIADYSGKGTSSISLTLSVGKLIIKNSVVLFDFDPSIFNEKFQVKSYPKLADLDESYKTVEKYCSEENDLHPLLSSRSQTSQNIPVSARGTPGASFLITTPRSVKEKYKRKPKKETFLEEIVENEPEVISYKTLDHEHEQSSSSVLKEGKEMNAINSFKEEEEEEEANNSNLLTNEIKYSEDTAETIAAGTENIQSLEETQKLNEEQPENSIEKANDTKAKIDIKSDYHYNNDKVAEAIAYMEEINEQYRKEHPEEEQASCAPETNDDEMDDEDDVYTELDDRDIPYSARPGTASLVSFPLVPKLPLPSGRTTNGDEKLQRNNKLRPLTQGGILNKSKFPKELLLQQYNDSTSTCLKASYKKHWKDFKNKIDEDKNFRVFVKQLKSSEDKKSQEKAEKLQQMQLEIQASNQEQLAYHKRIEEEQKNENKKNPGFTTIQLKPDEKYLACLLPREQLLQSLEQQMHNKEKKMKEAKVKALQEEKEFLDFVAQEIRNERRIRRRKRKEDRVLLKTTWEMEREFGNLKKMLNERGGYYVEDYISKTNLDAYLNETPRSDRPLEVKEGVTYHGIGFDARL